MIPILLIVVPCAVVGIAVVTLLDRGGRVLFPLDERGVGRGPTGRVECVPRTVLIGALVLMVGWALAWIVALAVGLRILSN